MRILRTTQAIRTWQHRQNAHKTSIGFVPTMGALHDGHRSLIARARKSCDTVVVSIFVNPLQFEPSDDFGHYPRDLSKDLTMCRKEKADAVFIPQWQDLYPHEFQTTVTVNKLSQRWEGEHRPTHFQGVTTIVTKLLNLVQPSQTFFGQKDYQQFLVIRQLVKDLELDAKLTLCPTIRDADGLALSSRNQYLLPAQRQQALLLYQALLSGKQAIKKGERRARVVEKHMAAIFEAKHQSHIDYLVCCEAKTLEPISRVQSNTVLLGALRIGAIRLIDNLVISVRE
jgi:pantoate--beta-alanine ligase